MIRKTYIEGSKLVHLVDIELVEISPNILKNIKQNDCTEHMVCVHTLCDINVLSGVTTSDEVSCLPCVMVASTGDIKSASKELEAVK